MCASADLSLEHNMRLVAVILVSAIMYLCFLDCFPVPAPNTVSGPQLVGLLFSKARFVWPRDSK